MTHSGGQPHNVGDKGQRYEITYFDLYENFRKVFGWSDTLDGARSMTASIDLHPSMQSPEINDRMPISFSEHFGDGREAPQQVHPSHEWGKINNFVCCKKCGYGPSGRKAKEECVPGKLRPMEKQTTAEPK